SASSCFSSRLALDRVTLSAWAARVKLPASTRRANSCSCLSFTVAIPTTLFSRVEPCCQHATGVATGERRSSMADPHPAYLAEIDSPILKWAPKFGVAHLPDALDPRHFETKRNFFDMEPRQTRTLMAERIR